MPLSVVKVTLVNLLQVTVISLLWLKKEEEYFHL